MVIGSPGSGKSTFSKKLAEKADTIICFKLSRYICIMRYLKRVITNINKIRTDMTEGCYEKIDLEFMKYIWNFSKIQD